MRFNLVWIIILKTVWLIWIVLMKSATLIKLANSVNSVYVHLAHSSRKIVRINCSGAGEQVPQFREGAERAPRPI